MDFRYQANWLELLPPSVHPEQALRTAPSLLIFKDELAILLGLAVWEKPRSWQETKARIHHLFFPWSWVYPTPNIWPVSLVISSRGRKEASVETGNWRLGFFFFFCFFFHNFGFPSNCDSLSLHCLPLLDSPHVFACVAYKVALSPDIVGKKPLPTRIMEWDFLPWALCCDAELESSVNSDLTQMGRRGSYSGERCQLCTQEERKWWRGGGSGDLCVCT